MTNHIISLDHLGLIQITGAGAQSLLQGQLTCNLNEFAPDTAYLGAHCNPQGRIISLFRIVAVTNGYLLQMPLNLLPSAFAALKKYAGFYQVELAIVTEQFDQFGFYGQPIANPASHLPACYFLHGELDRSLIFVAKSETLNWQATLPNTAIWGPATDWQALEITRGIPAVYLETSTKFLPHELNLPKLNAISFNKGCFTGQEIIARMQYRGKLKSQLYLAECNSKIELQRGEDIYINEQCSGCIVDFCEIANGQYQVLISAPIENIIPSNILMTNAGSQLTILDS